MKIKKYTATTMKEALVKVKHDLGDEAVILNSRKLKSNEPGNLSDRELFEITAAIDEMDHPHYKRPAAPAPATPMAKNVPLPVARLSAPEQYEKWKSVANMQELTSDMHDIKSTIRNLTEQIKYTNFPQLPQSLSKILITLLDVGIQNQLAQEMVQQISAELHGDELNDTEYLMEVLRSKLAGKIVTKSTARSGNGSPYIVALIGPTGVGKTTTLAKLATHPEIYGRDRVAFISSDTYRIAAIEQLRTFANIARIPMEVAYELDEVHQAVLRHYDKDVILVDTPGRSPYNQQHLAETKAFIERARPDEIHLVLSVTTRHEDAVDIVKMYNPMRINRFLFTKLDETQNPATIFNVANQFQKPISYITNGQEVPNDIRAVTPNYITNLILKENQRI